MSSATRLHGSIMAMVAIALVFDDESAGSRGLEADASPVLEGSDRSRDRLKTNGNPKR